MEKTFLLQIECLKYATFERPKFRTDYNGSLRFELGTGYKSYNV